MPNTYLIDMATGRAACKGRCRAKIPKGDVRLVTTTYSRPGPMSAWHPDRRSWCACCIEARQAAAVIAACGGEADLVPVHSRVPPDAHMRMVTAIGVAVCAANQGA